MDDSYLMDLFFSRSDDAVRETEKKYGTSLLALAKRILGTREDAEECVNDTYLRVWNDIPPARPDHFAGYLHAVTRRLSVDRLRRKTAKKRKTEYMLSLDELSECVTGGITPEEAYDSSCLREAVDRFLKKLSPENRAVFLYRYFYFLPVKEISSRTGYGEPKVKSLLYRMRIRLKEYLSAEDIPI